METSTKHRTARTFEDDLASLAAEVETSLQRVLDELAEVTADMPTLVVDDAPLPITLDGVLAELEDADVAPLPGWFADAEARLAA